MFYRIVRRLFLLVARPMFGLRVEGAARIPEQGAAVLVARHRSWLDPACVGAATPRPVGFLILDTVYHKPWARWFYRRMRGIPVSREASLSLSAVRSSLARLRRGELIGVFPEGRVFPERDPGRIHAGAALLSVHSGAPVIPIEIDGSARAWPHRRLFPRPGRVAVRVGGALHPQPAAARGPRAACIEEMVRSIERALGELAAGGSAAAGPRHGGRGTP